MRPGEGHALCIGKRAFFLSALWRILWPMAITAMTRSIEAHTMATRFIAALFLWRGLGVMMASEMGLVGLLRVCVKLVWSR